MTPATVDYGSVVYGDTLTILPQASVLFNGAAPPYSLAAVSVIFELRGVTVKTITQAAGLTISDAVNWVFSVAAFNVALDPGTYTVSVTTTDSAGNVYTFWQGALKVLPK
jgi:hypothetical protein